MRLAQQCVIKATLGQTARSIVKINFSTCYVQHRYYKEDALSVLRLHINYDNRGAFMYRPRFMLSRELRC